MQYVILTEIKAYWSIQLHLKHTRSACPATASIEIEGTDGVIPHITTDSKQTCIY
jgi:hypothetical protein